MVALVRISKKKLKDASQLTTLNISNNHLGDKGLEMLQDMFNRTTLQHIDISKTSLHGSGVKTFVRYCKMSRSSLTHVNINNNERIGSKGAELIGSFLSKSAPPRLIHIELGNVGASEGGASLTDGLCKLLEKGNELEYVNLKGFHAQATNPDNQKSLSKFVSHEKLRSLKYLDMSNSGMQKKEEEKLRELLLKRNKNCIILGDNDAGSEVTEESQFVQLSMRG